MAPSRWRTIHSLVILALHLVLGSYAAASQPNIVFIITDDQDWRLGSTDYQEVLQRELVAKGVTFKNHFGTIAQCCPARAAIFRGQAAHNTNITNVILPGGNYVKFVKTQEDRDYLPMWLSKAGYRTEYLGKWMNGLGTKSYDLAPGGPRGWNHTNVLIDPYINPGNNVVMSENGKRPLSYQGYHQSDVLRAMAIDRLERMDEDKPFFLGIGSGMPHTDTATSYPMPATRHLGAAGDVGAPRLPNWNPPDELQRGKPSWVGKLPLMNQSVIDFTDFQFTKRLESLLGIDDILEDVVRTLERKNLLNNTYIVYTSDNGWHNGNHRVQAGKTLPYIEDVNLPLFVRGPGIPQGVVSELPSTHIDFAPTFLEIAGLDKSQWPEFLDGSSVLDDWQHPTRHLDYEGEGNAKEILNVEFWGTTQIATVYGATSSSKRFANTTYKSLRVVGTTQSWLYNRWCSGETEFYDTRLDPYELHNLVNTTDLHYQRLMHRLNALLLVSKSCVQDICRDPWLVLQPSNATSRVSTLQQAMDKAYDSYYASFPAVAFKECLDFQLVENETPFYPANASQLIQTTHTQMTAQEEEEDNPSYQTRLVPPNLHPEGDWAQRNASLDEILKKALNVTDKQLNRVPEYPSVTTYGSPWPTYEGASEWYCFENGCDDYPASGEVVTGTAATRALSLAKRETTPTPSGP